MTAPAVILDRDGVINEDSDDYIRSVEEWHPIPGSLEAMARLTQAGYRVAIATNQSGVARGYLAPSELHRIHQNLFERLAVLGGRVEMIVYCPHLPEDQCSCRKPLPGMLQEIARRMGTSLQSVPFIGDSMSDLLAARAAGALPWLVQTGKGLRTLEKLAKDPDGFSLQTLPIHSDLGHAVDALLGARKHP